MINVAVVPAKGHSEGIPNKNMTHLGGKPLLKWTIDVCCECLDHKTLDHVIISTDSDEIEKYCKSFGLRVFRRDPRLSAPDVHAYDVVEEVLMNLAPELIDRHVAVHMLLPTSPFRNCVDVEIASNILKNKPEAQSVIGVRTADRPTGLRISASSAFHYLRRPTMPILAKGFNTQRQNEPKMLQVNGAIFCARQDDLLHNKSFHMDRTLAYSMPKVRSLEIDDREDLIIADQLARSPFFSGRWL